MKKIYSFLILAFFLIQNHAFAQPACSGTPASNTAVCTSTNFCAGYTATLSLVNAYTATGIVYQWAYSTVSALGPWTAVSGANSATLATTTLTDAAYYTVVIGCTNSFMTATATAVYLNISVPGATTTVPYFEGFQVNANNELPNCSWSASSLGTNCLTYSTAARAAFAYSASVLGQQSFYTMGVQLNSTVVYSASVWQSTSQFSANDNWSNFGLSVGPNQSVLASTVITAAAAPATGVYANRSGTFTVASSGIYYLRIFADAVSGSTIAPFIYFDDLSITLPCSNQGNAASATLTPSSNTICAGNTVTINISASPNCTVSGGTTQTFTPAVSSVISVVVTNSLSGCLGTSSLLLIVNPSPIVLPILNPQAICNGSNATLYVVGNGTYTLLPGNIVFTNSVLLSPTITTNYSLLGTNISGCSSSSTVTLNVNDTPTIVLSPASATVCKGENYTTSASGASSYYVGSSIFSSAVSVYNVSKDSTYQVRGKGANGCMSIANLVVVADECAGIHVLSGNEVFSLFPNPNDGSFNVVISESANMTIRDLTGRLIFELELPAGNSRIEQKHLARGIYFIEVKAGQTSTKKRLIIE